jgi:RHS repeat-associated protein
VRETSGAQRVLKTFTYSPSNVTDALGTDWSKGKIVSTSRFNYVGAPFNATAEVRDTMAYRAAEGRVSETSRQLIFNAVDKEKFTTTYAYDGLGLVSTLGYPDCVFGDCTTLDTPRTVTFNYNYGRLASVPGITGTISYYTNGLVNQVPHANGVLFTQQNDPNAMMRPAGMTSTLGATTLWTAGTYAYDGAGSVKATGTQTYVYDSLGRITQGNLPGSTQSYSYDNYGNLQSITTDMSVQNTPTSSSTNRLTAGTYDAAGNLTAWSGNTYEYDAFNQLARYHSGTEDWAYVYGPDDERFWSYRVAGSGPGSIWTLRDLSGHVLRQYNSHVAWGNYEDYVYRDGLLLAGLLSDGQQRHFDVDHLGTVRLVTDAAGNQVAFHRYYPFGKEQTALQEADRMKFTGHERDLANVVGDGDDLDYMHARHYSLITGRFQSTDLAQGRPESPQSWNRYSYGRNSPMSFVDPDGLEPLDPAVRNFLERYYGANLSGVQVHHGFFARLLANQQQAITFGHQIFMSRYGWSVYSSIHSPGASRSQAIAGIALAGHEVTHTLQSEQFGLTVFLIRYLAQWASVGFDYSKIPFELMAFANQKEIEKLLLSDPSLLESILAGGASQGSGSVTVWQQPTVTNWSIITSLGGGPLGGWFGLSEFGGTVYIDGINLTGVL